MPRRLIVWSRTEPARTILFVVGFLTLIAQLLTLTPWVSSQILLQLPNVVLVGGVCGWAVWSAWVNHVKQMSLSCFWLFLMWLWSGLTRLMFSPDPAMLLWIPFLVVAAALGICYIYLSYQKKMGVSRGMATNA